MASSRARELANNMLKQEENFYGLQTARQPEAETAARRRDHPIVANPD
jgi:hypothetical protein